MSEDTTTVQATDTQTGAELAQPVTDVSTQAADVQPASEPSNPSQDAPQSDAEPQATADDSAPQVDEKLQKYAKSQGLELDSPSAIKAAQIAMKNQSEATRTYQRASELEKTVSTVSDQYAEAEAAQTGQDPELLKTVRGLQIENAVNKFWNTPLANGDLPDKGLEQAMIAEVQSKPYLAGDFESLYATALFKSGSAENVKSQAKRETLEELAHTQTAAVPRGNATNSSMTPAEKPFQDLSIQEMEQKLGFVRR
jgi:hypothetical protein